MVQHTWRKLCSFPLVFVILFAIGIFIPGIIAISSGYVTPYVPYISQGGSEVPEAGIFRACISLSVFLCQWTIIVRYLVVEEMNSALGNYMNDFLNKISLVLGGISTLALIFVVSYPASTLSQVHNSTAGLSCVCYVFYLVFNTFISFRILGASKISYCRLVVTILSILSFIFITVFGLIASPKWTAAGKKTPQHKGFEFYVVSACFEWVLALLIMLYFSTYLSEFKRSSLHFQIQFSSALNKPKQTNEDAEKQGTWCV